MDCLKLVFFFIRLKKSGSFICPRVTKLESALDRQRLPPPPHSPTFPLRTTNNSTENRSMNQTHSRFYHFCTLPAASFADLSPPGLPPLPAPPNPLFKADRPINPIKTQQWLARDQVSRPSAGARARAHADYNSARIIRSLAWPYLSQDDAWGRGVEQGAGGCARRIDAPLCIITRARPVESPRRHLRCPE